MPLADIAHRLTNDTVADQFVEYIHSEGRDMTVSPAQYIEKYFDKAIRQLIFAGTNCAGGGIVTLSDKAVLLRDAFRRRFANTQEFPPMVAYHGTKDIDIAKLILKGGFDQAREQLFGPGVYFYVATSSYRAESIAIQAGKQSEDEQDINLHSKILDTKARRDARETDKKNVDRALFSRKRLADLNMKSNKYDILQAMGATRLANVFSNYGWDKGCVLRVTIHANTGFNSGADQQHKDRLVEQKDDVLVVKNPLVVFPEVVFIPGDELHADAANQSAGIANSLSNLSRLHSRYQGR